ncbi:hypothetical protein Tco_0540243 [Tanacetum coccineum]
MSNRTSHWQEELDYLMFDCLLGGLDLLGLLDVRLVSCTDNVVAFRELGLRHLCVVLKTPEDYCVATSNRGHVLSAGLTTDPAFVLTGTMGSGSIYATHTCSPYEEIRILKNQNDDLKKKMKDAEAQRVADQLALQRTLNVPELLNRILVIASLV